MSDLHNANTEKPIDPRLLFSGYLENRLNKQEFEQLVQWIHADRENARAFMRHCMLVEHIRDELHFDDVNEMPIEEASDGSAILRSFHELLAEEQKQSTVIVDISDEIERRDREAKSRERVKSQRWRLSTGEQSPNRSETRHYVIPKPLFYGSIAALVAVTVSIIAAFVDRSSPETNQSIELPPIVAKLTRVVNADFTEHQSEMTIGTRIRAGRIQLSRGMAEIEFEEGASLIIEGPAVVDLDSIRSAYLRSGKVVGHVPKGGEGFTVKTDSATIIDLGTEFAVDASRSGGTRVHVFNGKVSLKSSNEGASESVELSAGSARQVAAGTGTISTIPFDNVAFVRNAELEAREKAALGSKYHQWLVHTYDLRRRSDLMAYYIFEDSSPSLTEPNVANDVIGDDGETFRSSAFDLRIPRSVKWERGRFAQKGAINFSDVNLAQVTSASPVGDAFGGEVRQISAAMWIRLDRIEGGQSVLQLGPSSDGVSDFGFDLPDTTMHLTLGLKGFGRLTPQADPDRPFILTDWRSHIGQWRHLVAVYDADADGDDLLLYVDGELAASRRLGRGIPLDLRGAVLRLGDFKFKGVDYQRPLQGAVDEVAIFRTALDAEEIKMMHEAGRR